MQFTDSTILFLSFLQYYSTDGVMSHLMIFIMYAHVNCCVHSHTIILQSLNKYDPLCYAIIWYDSIYMYMN